MMRPRFVLPLLVLIACAAANPAAKAAGPAGDRSAPFKVIVVLDDRARAELAKRKEGIVVGVTFADPNDDQGYRHQEIELGSEGGEASVGPIDLSPAKAGGARLTNMDINVFSARKSGPTNLLNCSFAGDDAASLQPTYTVSCTLL